MNIKLKNIPIFQNGGGVPQWYLDRYGNRTSLVGWNPSLRYNYSNLNLNTNGHRNAGNLDTVYKKNMAYIGTPGAISSDILAFYNSDGKGMSAEDFVKFYNTNAEKIRLHWSEDLTYNAKTAGDHNRLFRKMFVSRSNLSMSPGSDYNIGYLDDLENIEGSSTWLRRMDLYENKFDINNPDSNRMHEITLSDGSKATFYKEANGDIGLIKSTLPTLEPVKTNSNKFSIPVIHKETNKPNFNLKNLFNSNLIGLGRLAGNLINNNSIYDEALKGISPTLKQSYHTYRLVTGDEATRLAYYKRAIRGLTKASRPFTSDADKLMAYKFEAKKAADDLMAQGDLANNLEIRRTSDESNLHSWANKLRDTEIANANLAEIIKSNAEKHNLLALKKAAQWSSIDNYLLDLETKKLKQEKERDFKNKQIWLLLEQYNLENNPEYQTLLANARNAWKNAYAADNDPSLDEAYKTALKKLKNFLYQNLIRMLLEMPMAKSGTKLTKKDKDDLLYKTSKDIVEHFRKISKISSDAFTKRKNTKIEKLTSHPKGGTKKYLLGGSAPFTVYRPATLGGETTTSSQADTSSTSKSSSGNDLDLIKELFKSLQTEGLPSDVNQIYTQLGYLFQRQQDFGGDLSTDDISSMYILLMQKINMIKFNKALFDKAQEIVHNKNASSEYAVDPYGRVAVLNIETGKVSLENWDKVKSSDTLRPLSNNDILNIRALSPTQALDNSLLHIASNATSMTEIAKFLKEQLPKIGSSELTIEGYTKLDSNMIREGLQLLKEAPAGDYKFTLYNKLQLKEAKMAMNYLMGVLPRNMKTLLKINSEMLGTSSESLIASLIGSTLDESSKLEFDAVTGKAAKDSNGNSKVGGDDGLKLDAATALISGKGYQSTIEFNPGTSYAVTVNARHSGFLKKSGENMGSGITMLEATTSTLDKVLDWNKATLGGSRINSTGYNRILLNNDDVVGVDLPIGNDKNTPDFSMLLKLQTLDLELLKRGIDDIPLNFKLINLICLEVGLPPKYKNDGSLNNYSWNRFAAFQVIADDSVLLNKDAILDDTLDIVEDDDVRELYEAMILKNLNTKDYTYKLGNGFLGIGKLALYLGTVFVPINANYVASALSGGQNISMSQATDLELQLRGYDLSKVKNYRPAINFNEL